MKRYKVALVVAVLLIVLAGCSQADPQREAILAFTRQALQIETERAELMQNFADWGHGPGASHIIGRTFLKGVTVSQGAPHDLAGMSSLYQRFLLLDSPQSMQPIKDSLSYIYNAEIQQFRMWQEASAAKEMVDNLRSEVKPYGFTGTGPSVLSYIHPEVTKDNLDYWKQVADAKGGSANMVGRAYLRKIEDLWGQLQAFRRDVYIQWAQLLQQHGIDPDTIMPTPPGVSGGIPTDIGQMTPDLWKKLDAETSAILGKYHAGNQLTPEEEATLREIFK